MHKIHKFIDRMTLASELAREVEIKLLAAISMRGRATLAVAGGKTPALFFDVLSCANIDWSAVQIILTDERFVPESSKRSNLRLVRRHLLQNKASTANIIGFYQNFLHLDLTAEMLSMKIKSFLPLDVCVLGMGMDMHTASLFPMADKLELALSNNAPPIVALRVAGVEDPRLTLSAPVLSSAKKIYILITRQDKLAALHRAMNSASVFDAPIRCVLHQYSAWDVYYAE